MPTGLNGGDGASEPGWTGSETGPGPEAAPALELAPAAWVPALPLPARRARAARGARAATHAAAARCALARLVALLAIGAATFVLSSGIAHSGASAACAPPAPLRLAPALIEPVRRAAATLADCASRTRPAPLGVLRTPRCRRAGPDRAPIAPAARSRAITYPSLALGWRDSYLVYLPPGYRAGAPAATRCSTCCTATSRPAASFLRLGLQPTLDRLIATHAIAPMIAVMLAGATALPDNWRNTPGPQLRQLRRRGRSGSTDAILRTLTEPRVTRDRRLLDGRLRRDGGRALAAAPLLGGRELGGLLRQPLAACSPRTAGCWREPAAARVRLRAGARTRSRTPPRTRRGRPRCARAGADAQSALYPGGHAFAPLERHLAQMLTLRGSRAAKLTASAITTARGRTPAPAAPRAATSAPRAASSPPRASSSAAARMRYAIDTVGPRGSRPGVS